MIKDVQDLRYQLLHRAASAIIEAQRFRAEKATMLVQSFCPLGSGHQDYSRFCRAMALNEDGRDRVTRSRLIDGILFSVGWVSDRPLVPTEEIADVRMVTLMHPSQWEGRLVDGRPLFIHYKWGRLKVHFGRREGDTDSALALEPWFDGEVGPHDDCCIELDGVFRATGLAFKSSPE